MKSVFIWLMTWLALFIPPAWCGEKTFDLLIEHGTILTMNRTDQCFDDGYILISDGRIQEVNQWHDGVRKLSATKRIQADGRIILPGLINLHTHVPMTLFRGLSDDTELDVWLRQIIWPAEAKFVDAEFVKTGTELGIVEMLQSGTTTFCDMYFFEDIVGETAARLGIRAFLGETILQFPSPSCKTGSDALAYTRQLFEKWKNHSLVQVTVAPHSSYVCTPDLLFQAKQLADEYDAPLQIHLSETKKEVDDCLKAHGQTPPAFLDGLGFFKNAKVIAAHCVHLTPEDIMLFQRHQVGVSHNPQSNLKLGSGIAPVADFIRQGVPVGIGTDGPASNNDLNLFDELKTACLLQKGINQNSTILSAKESLRMATINGAEILGIGDEVGSLEPGKKADLVVLDVRKPHLTPGYDPFSLAVYSMNGSEVEHVVVNGKMVVCQGSVVNIRMDELMKKVEILSRKIEINKIKNE